MMINITRKIIPILALVLLAGWGLSRGDDMSEQSYVRPPAVAGAFYPDSPSELAKMIAAQFAAAPKPAIGVKPTAIICPHAGYIYSGGIAAKGYKILEGESYSTVIVISPSHTIAFNGVSAFKGKAYSTPFGEVPIDEALTDQIASYSDIIKVSNTGHEVGNFRSEHALEVQLPFLQTALGKFQLVALMMGEQRYEVCEALGDAMAKALEGREDVLIVASSDLSHFHTSDQAKKLDSVIKEDVKNFNYKRLSTDLEAHKTEACGGGPIIATMIASEKLGANGVEITGYGDSGDVTGDHSNVVGYLSAVIYKAGEAGEEKVYDLDASQNESENSGSGEIHDNPASGVEFGLSATDKQALLKLARESIETAFEDKDPPYPAKISPALNEKLGAFVTLNRDNKLRGCIGTFHADESLYRIVARMARQAAFSDPRFPPVEKKEMGTIDIEISVLTPMKRIEDPESVEVGRDGLYMIKGYQSGVLLPQVPVEWGWDRLRFLQQTCLKAGLNPDAWKDKDTEIYTFQAEIFGEE